MAQSNNQQLTIEFEDKIEVAINRNTITMISFMSTFASQFAFAVENVFITSLLIQYSTEPEYDSFIWIIPNVLGILLIPYIQSYITKFKVPMTKYLSFMVLNLMLASLGHYLVILSTLPEYLLNIKTLPISYHFTRIGISVIGWTLVDLCLEIVASCNDEVKAIMIQKNVAQEDEEQENVGTFAKIAAYGISFLSIGKDYSIRNFHLDCSRMYYISGLLCVTAACGVFAINKIKVTKGAEQQKKSRAMYLQYAKETILGVKISLSSFFPGAIQTIKAPIHLKIILTQIFMSTYVLDTIFIYGSIWIATTVKVATEDLTAQKLTLGVKYGALLFLAFSVISHLTKSYYSTKLNQRQYKITYFLIVAIQLGLYGWLTQGLKLQLVAVTLLVGGIFSSLSELYIQEKEQMLTRFYQQFQTCEYFVNVIQKLFVLSTMPFYWMIIKQDDDITGCIWWGVYALGVILLIIMYEFMAKPQISSESSDKKEN